MCVLGVACGSTVTTGVQEAQLTMRVRTALLNDAELGTQEISVGTAGRTVSLSGRVERDDLIERALDVVRGVDGVGEVLHTLEVGPPDVFSRQPPGRLPALALDDDGPPHLLALGLAGTISLPDADHLGKGGGVGPLIRLRPGNGWGPTVGFTWTKTGIEAGPDGQPGLARLRIRPVMAGIQYGVTRGRLAAAFSVVGGYSFNGLLPDTEQAGAGRALAVGNSLVWRPGASLSYEVTRRVGLNVFGGYLMTKPDVTFASDAMVDTRRLDVDTVIITFGAAYWIF